MTEYFIFTLDKVKRKKVHVIYVLSLHRTSPWVLRRWSITQRVPHCPVSAFISITGPSASLEHLPDRQTSTELLTYPAQRDREPAKKRNVHIQTADTHLGFTYPRPMSDKVIQIHPHPACL